MRGRKMLWLFGVLLTLVAAVFLYWQLRYPTHTYRFMMTVEVQTPEGVHSGSSIYEISARNEPKLLPDMRSRSTSVRGEAAAVDLPDGRTVFALLKTSAHWGGMEGLSMNSLHPDFPGAGYDMVDVAKELAEGKHSGPVNVDPDDYPMLVTFSDLNDPTSVELVDPNDLASKFGDGVTLRRIIVQITDDPVTKGIEGRLDWLEASVGSIVNRSRDVPIGEMPIEHRINKSDFRRRSVR